MKHNHSWVLEWGWMKFNIGILYRFIWNGGWYLSESIIKIIQDITHKRVNAIFQQTKLSTPASSGSEVWGRNTERVETSNKQWRLASSTSDQNPKSNQSEETENDKELEELNLSPNPIITPKIIIWLLRKLNPTRYKCMMVWIQK